MHRRPPATYHSDPAERPCRGAGRSLQFCASLAWGSIGPSWCGRTLSVAHFLLPPAAGAPVEVMDARKLHERDLEKCAAATGLPLLRTFREMRHAFMQHTGYHHMNK